MSDLLDPILGLVRRCSTCGEEWPSDEEFFRLTHKGGLRHQCRACQGEVREERRAQLRVASQGYRQRRRTA